MKRFKSVIAILLILVSLSTFAYGCKPESEWSGEGVVGFKLSHASPKSHQGDADYNSDLFYLNETTLTGADPGALFVSKEDAINSYEKRKRALKYENGGELAWIDGWSEQRFIETYGTFDEWVSAYADVFYCAVTSEGAGIGSDIIRTMFYSYKSKDLVSWEPAATLSTGASIAVYKDEWANGAFAWAPEYTYDQESGLYFMFFSSQSRDGGVDDVYVTNDHGSTWDTLYVSCAISETPTGPYRLATAENYFNAIAKKNADGTLVKGSEAKPSADLDRDGAPDTDLYELYAISDDRVIGYVDADGAYYTLNGYVIDAKTPVLNTGYYYPRLATDKAKVAEFESTYHITNHEPYADSGIDNCIWPSIDVNPVVDSLGNKYLYFCQHSSTFNGSNEIWAVAMKDWLTPDWDTLARIAAPDYESVVQNGTLAGEAVGSVPGEWLNEGTFVIEHNGKWYFTYSPYGYGDRSYSVHVAVADGPFGPFVKLKGEYSPIIGVGEEPLDMIGGTGHHCFMQVGDELWAIYHAFYNGVSTGAGRSVAVDKVVWKYDPDLGYDMLFGNGPSINLQPKPEKFTGYTNVAKYATVTGNGDKGSIENLTDGMFTAQPFSRKFEYGKSDGELKISLKWDKAVTVKALMLYTSGCAYEAFSKVNYVVFKLSEKPAWYSSDQYNGYCYIENLTVDPFEYQEKNQLIRKGASAIAEFNEISITEMHIYISGKDAKFVYEDNLGNPSNSVSMAEIYLFGN